YYLRTQPKAQAIQFTVDAKAKNQVAAANKADAADKENAKIVNKLPPAPAEEELCLSCGA
ncbi:hypothetical protein TeGR_g9897, partial [Tetraparma gracilis]